MPGGNPGGLVVWAVTAHGRVSINIKGDIFHIKYYNDNILTTELNIFYQFVGDVPRWNKYNLPRGPKMEFY